jgi:hypothetical protein
MNTCRWITSVAFALAAATATAREFQDSFGRSINAELVSHTGVTAETVKINKGGKEITVKVSLFSEDDQKFIRDWMGKTAPKLNYSFRVDTSKTAEDGAKAHAEKITYDVKLTNQTREPVSNLRVEYRAYMMDYTGGGGAEGGLRKWAAKRFGKRSVENAVGKSELVQKHVDGEVKIEGPLRFNQSATFTTSALKIDERDGGRFSAGYKDEILGVIVRIYDMAGKMVFEHRDIKTKDFKWGDEDEKPAGAEVRLD